MKLNAKLLLIAGVTMSALLTAGYAWVSLMSNKPSVWQQVQQTPEALAVISQHLNLNSQFTAQKAIDSATFQSFGASHRVYRFIAPQTCGSWGCLHVVVDNYLQQTKAYHLKNPPPPGDRSYLSIDQNNCVLATQVSRQQVMENYSLCLQVN